MIEQMTEEFLRQAKEVMNDNSFFAKVVKEKILFDYENLKSELIERTENRMSEQADKRVNDLIYEKICCPAPYYFIPRVGEHSLLDSIGNKEDMGALG